MSRIFTSLALLTTLTLLGACGAPAIARSEPAVAAPTPPSPDARPTVRIDSARARALIQGGAVVVDVRTPGEFAQGHVEGATNIPVQELGGRLDEVRALVGERPGAVVVYCQSGRRSTAAAQLLIDNGFTAVTNGGGFASLR